MRIGIMGGGQLGLMLAQAAAAMGITTVVFAQSDDEPALQVANCAVLAEFGDRDALRRFAGMVGEGRVLLEFENVPVDSLRVLESLGVHVCPSSRALAVAQDRFREKLLARELNIPTTQFCNVMDLFDDSILIKDDPSECFPGIVKAVRDGYDGKEQYSVVNEEQVRLLLPHLKTNKSYILERRVEFAYEFSVIVARTVAGEMSFFPATVNRHEDGVLRESNYRRGFVGDLVERRARKAAAALAEHLEVEGLLAVEFFALPGGQVLFNEMAPRPHNSGHWTIEGCNTSQFAADIRAALGMRVGDTSPRVDAARMLNLLGSEEKQAPAHEAHGGFVHLYGKKEARPGRKMGHVTYLGRQPVMV